jgi:hypothetical protein
MNDWAWIGLFLGIALLCALGIALIERREDRIAREARQQERDDDSWWGV